MDHYQFLFEAVTEEEKDILIALLSDEGFSGFEEEGATLRAYIPTPDFEENLFDQIIKTTGTTYFKSIVKEVNWNEKWETDFDPVMVLDPKTGAPFAKVRASFHEPDENVLYDIVVTPKMSFGTGHHATTYLMIERMGMESFRDKTVIDFGTGTGVLAILAEKMGAAQIEAIDNDDWSINNARENIATNHCTKINLYKAETIGGKVKADIILANINLNVIISNLDEILNACKAATHILFSGILLQDKESIIQALEKKGIVITNVFEKNNWIALETKYIKQ